jgi:hypothetical protein
VIRNQEYPGAPRRGSTVAMAVDNDIATSFTENFASVWKEFGSVAAGRE